MKLEVFEYLLAIEKYGSLNKAASHLYVSQPNLSNVLTSFENELGYPVIYRNHQGVHFTEQGKQVLLIAHNILKEKDKLFNLSLEQQKLSLKISVGNGDYALTPLYPLLKNTDEIRVTIMNCAVMQALEYTYQQLLDLAYFIIPVSMEKQIMDYAQNHHLQIDFLKELRCEINVREGHPLLENFSKERLWNYPFVDFINQRPNAYDTYQPYINPNKIIEVDHHSLRGKIVSQSDAFSIGIPLNRQTKEKLHLIGIPTPELKMRIYEARRINDKDHTLFNQYKKIIEQELLQL